jgi:hypothetical protein
MVVVFKKLFGGKKAPIIEGKSSISTKVDGVRWVKKFILELSNMEGSPTYNLSHQLTVGSEVGNIVIADPSVSPRHCTFILQEEVVSVLDHGSVAGTFINGQKIPPGRYIILEENDNIKVGDLEVQIHTKNEAIKQEIPEDELEEEVEAEEEIEEEEAVEEEKVAVKKEPKLAMLKKWFKIKPSKTKKDSKKSNTIAISGNSSYATNSLVRVIAVLCDLLVAYALSIVFMPFDEFRSFVADVPAMLGSLLDIDWNGLWSVINEEYAFVGEMLKDLYSFFSTTFNFGPLILLFFAVRLVSTLLFGVSISEAFLGVRSHGNVIWKRIGGVLRVVVGIVTGPFLIFDVPALISKRTFKEFMTFTHTYINSKFVTILGIIFYVPVLTVAVLMSPLIQGLELPEPIAVKDVLDKRVKVIQTGEAAVEVIKTYDFSSFLNIGLEYDTQGISLVPNFRFSGKKNKLTYKPALAVYHKELQRSVTVEVFKTFDFKELLGLGFKGDPFLTDKFPLIEGYVYSSEVSAAAFKKSSDEKESRKFADEVVSFTKIAFELNANNVLDFMQVYTPILKGFMDYRSSLLGLIEYKEFDQIDFIKLGNAYFLRFSYTRQKPFDLLIPLIQGEGRVLKIEFDKKENLGVLRNKFYKFSLEGSDWFPPRQVETAEQDALRPLQVLDLFSKLDVKGDKISPEKAQALYGYYYEKSGVVLKNEDPAEYELWKSSVEGIFTIMTKMKDSIPKVEEKPVPEVVEAAPEENTAPPAEAAPSEAPVEVTEDPRLKLFQNFQDLKDAVENKNKEYFGSEENTTI